MTLQVLGVKFPSTWSSHAKYLALKFQVLECMFAVKHVQVPVTAFLTR